MLNWVYFIRSNREYHKLMGFLIGEEVSGVTYLVFDEDVECTDSRIFLKDNEYLVAVNFFTYSSSFKESMVRADLDPESLVDLYEIICEGEDPYTKGITITERAKRIIFDKELKKFLSITHFRFRDGSIFTIPEINLRYRL